MIPQGWKEKTLGEILDKGSSNLSANKLTDCVGIYPVYGAAGLIAKVNFYQQDKEYLAIIKDGAGVGRVYHYQPKTSVLGTLQYLYPKSNTDIRFAYYYLQSIDFAKYYQGAAIPHIYYRDYKSEKLVLPPLPEQERIVAKLDKAFEAIDKVKANAEKNLNNAKEIYNIKKELIFKTVLENKPVEFGDIIELLTDYHANGSYKLLKEHVELLDNENYAWMIRSTDFENEFKNNFKYINEKAYNFLEKTKIFGNEIIMSKIGNAGKIYLMPVVNRPVSLAMNLFLIRVKEKLAISSYVYRFLLTNIGQKQINERCKGAATQTITKDNVRSIKIYLPNTLSEQQKIVEKLDALQEQTKKLEQIYTQKIKKCDELKQSILQKAFRGEL